MKFVYHIHSEEMLKTFLQRHNYSKKTISAIKRDGALIINRQPVTVRYMLKKMINLLLNCGRSSKVHIFVLQTNILKYYMKIHI